MGIYWNNLIHKILTPNKRLYRGRENITLFINSSNYFPTCGPVGISFFVLIAFVLLIYDFFIFRSPYFAFSKTVKFRYILHTLCVHTKDCIEEHRAISVCYRLTFCRTVVLSPRTSKSAFTTFYWRRTPILWMF